MSEVEAQDVPSFIAEPLLFFGQDVTFSRPPGFYNELAGVEEKVRILSDDWQRTHPDDDPEETKKQLLIAETQDVYHHWYEVQFRGRYAIDGLSEHHRPVHDWLYDKTDVDFTDRPEAVAGLLNETLSLAHWNHGMQLASRWYNKLPENSPLREVAANYIGFSGNVVLNEYCRLAIKLADDQLSDDWMVRTKHLITVCWNIANYLEEFTPNEVAVKKQLLREVFLEYAAQDNTGEMRRWVNIFLYETPEYEAIRGNIKACHELEQDAFTEIVRMDNLDANKRQQLINTMEQRVQLLLDDKEYPAAVDLLDTVYRALGLDLGDIQKRLDSIVRLAISDLAADMRDYDVVNDDGDWYSFQPSREQLVNDLLSRPSIPEETVDELTSLVLGRKLEYKLEVLKKTDPVNGALAIDVLEEISANRPERTQALASEQIVFLAQAWQRRAASVLSPGTLDSEFSTILGVFLNRSLAATHLAEFMDGLLDQFIDQAGHRNTHLSFQHLAALLSVLVRRSKEPDTPDQAPTWKYTSKDLVKRYCESLLANGTAPNRESHEFIARHLSHLLQDVHGWLKVYWQEVQEYD